MVRSIGTSSRSTRSHHNAGKSLKNPTTSENSNQNQNEEEEDEIDDSEDDDGGGDEEVDDNSDEADSDATEENITRNGSLTDDDSEDDDQTGSESEEEASLKIENSKRPRKRRPSILDHALNAADIVFPRSESALASSDDEHDVKAMEEMNELSGLESGTEFGDDYLLSLLDQEESSDEYHDAMTDSDEDKMEEEEEKNILHEVSQDELESSQSPLDSNAVILSLNAKQIDDKHDDEWDDDEQSEVSFDDDFFERPLGETKQSSQRFIKSTTVPGESDDDSYLWSYFFSDGNSDSEMEEPGKQSNLSSPSGRSKNKRRSYSRRSGRSTDPEEDDSMDGTGESTDEDLTIPPPSHRRAGARATEVLSSSSMAARPPVLGTWVMSPERPSGIIDGLTTRTLSPPLPVDRGHSVRGHRQNFLSENRKRSQQTFDDDDDESDLGQLALEEFIYTSELDDSSGDQDIGDQLTTPWNSRIKSDIPLSAFRNRGMHHAYSTGSPSVPDSVISKRHALKHRRSKEPVITPVRGLRRRSEMQKQKRSRKYESLQETEYHDTLDASDLIEELVGIGALSPLFNGLA